MNNADDFSTNYQQHKTQRELMLQVNLKFEEGDLNECRELLSQCAEEDPETMVAQATLYSKEGRHNDALDLFLEVLNIQGFETEIAYNIALCHYMIGETQEALEAIQDIIDRAMQSYPELCPKTIDDEEGMQEISNSIHLQDSFLIESYNLKAAIEFGADNISKARRTLKQMPQRKEEEIDPVTLHNHGLMDIDVDVKGGFEKLNFLVANPPFPPETFGNLLLLYCKFGHHDLSADILAENSHLTYDFLTEDLYDYLDTIILAKASPEKALEKFESMNRKYTTDLRKFVQDMESDDSSQNSYTKQLKINYQSTLNSYIPVLMAQAHIYWQQEKYSKIEQIFHKSADLCVDVDTWKLNVAHTFYIQQGSKFRDAIKYYDTFVKEKSTNGLLNIAPNVLANLCVSYIMTNQNEEAEEIMRLIEKEEETQNSSHRDTPQLHHGCIVNIVIGTLYCEKGNFEFGVSRICKSLEPMKEKLGADTWYYAKRCILALLDHMAKQMIQLGREAVDELVVFLKDVEFHGTNMTPEFGDHREVNFSNEPSKLVSSCISSEATQIQYLLCKLLE